MTNDETVPEHPFSVVYVIGTYPLLTTTFIDREIELLRTRGVDVHVVSIRPPHGLLSPRQVALAADVDYVMPVKLLSIAADNLWYLTSAPVAYVRTFWDLLTAPHPRARHRGRTVLHFGLAVHVTRRIARRGGAEHVHAHFVDRAALVAMVVSRLLGVPYSATAHANDIYVDPVLLPQKVRGAKFLATCTDANAEHLARKVSGADRIRRIHHGLDLQDFSQVTPATKPGLPMLLAVGQLKEKKGFAYLVEACRLLVEEGRDFRCEIIGDGPLRSRLEAAISEAGLERVVTLRGALPSEEVTAAYTSADVFVLPCVIGSDGDRDGIPNVILEAMASGLPVVSTAHSGISEAVIDGATGLLTVPGDAGMLARATATLLDDDGLRRAMGREGRRRVAERFDVQRNVDLLLKEFTA